MKTQIYAAPAVKGLKGMVFTFKLTKLFDLMLEGV